MRERLGPSQDARSIINNGRRAQHDDDVHQVAMRAGDTDLGQTIAGSGEMYPRCGRQLDDRSPSPDGLGPWAFGRHIQRAPLPQRFRPPTNIAKYTRETNPEIWLEDFWLACRAGGVDDDHFIIQYLPIYVGEHDEDMTPMHMTMFGPWHGGVGGQQGCPSQEGCPKLIHVTEPPNLYKIKYGCPR